MATLNTNSFFGRQNGAIGPASVYFGTGTGSAIQNLGMFDAVEVVGSVKKSPIKFDKYGTEPANMVITGGAMTVKVGLAQATLERLGLTIDGWHNNLSGSTVLGYSWGIDMGSDDLTKAQELRITLVVGDTDSTDPLDTIKCWLAVPAADFSLKYDAGTQRFVGNLFTIYKDSNHLNTAGKATFFGSGTY